MANADYVNGVQQHPISKKNFAQMAAGQRAEVEPVLHQLRGVAEQARAVRSDLFLLIGTPEDSSLLLQWLQERDLTDLAGTIMVKGLIVAGDFGVTIETFLPVNERLNHVLAGGAGS